MKLRNVDEVKRVELRPGLCHRFVLIPKQRASVGFRGDFSTPPVPKGARMTRGQCKGEEDYVMMSRESVLDLARGRVGYVGDQGQQKQDGDLLSLSLIKN
jgi:hypothetical protein